MPSITEQLAREAQARDRLLSEMWRCVRQMESWAVALKKALEEFQQDTGADS